MTCLYASHWSKPFCNAFHSRSVHRLSTSCMQCVGLLKQQHKYCLKFRAREQLLGVCAQRQTPCEKRGFGLPFHAIRLQHHLTALPCQARPAAACLPAWKASLRKLCAILLYQTLIGSSVYLFVNRSLLPSRTRWRSCCCYWVLSGDLSVGGLRLSASKGSRAPAQAAVLSHVALLFST